MRLRNVPYALGVAIGVVLVMVLALPGRDGAVRENAEAAAAPSNPTLVPDGGVANVTFYYQGTLPLTAGNADELVRRLGRASIVVTNPAANDSAVVDAIHSAGAKAYRYVQFYWAPDNVEYEGIDLREHPDWAFCRRGTRGSIGRTTDGGATKWYFLDTNEQAVRDRIESVLAGYKAEGWDGVMFDRGEAATQYASDIDKRPVWSRASTCTHSPYQRGARFADAYVSMIGLAHQSGLQVMLNNGKSPFDRVAQMRPDPTDKACRKRDWSACRFLSDVWPKVDLVLAETATRPRDVDWARTFASNAASEASRKHGRRTVALVTTATLGGASQQRRPKVFYEWSRIKLFDLPVGVNTGDDKCATSTDAQAVCNRYGVYPELVDTAFGPPLSSGPTSASCVRGSRVRCLWTRRYADGMDVLNASPERRRRVTVALGLRRCRYVYDVYHDRALADDQCVKKVSLRLPGWSGRPLRYSRSPW